MGGQLVSDAELSEEVFSGSDGSDFENENYSQKKNKNIAIKKVNWIVKLGFIKLFLSLCRI